MANGAGISRMVLGLIATAALGSAAAHAQDPKPASTSGSGESRQAGPDRGSQASERGDLPAAHGAKRTVLHFEDDSIRGDLTRPDGELVQAPRRVAEGSLVRLRKSFIDRALGGAVRGE